MANSIGSVFIDLKADTSHLVNGFNRAEKMAQKTTDMLVKMAGAVGLAWGGLEIKNFIDQQAEVAKGASLVAEQYAISVEELTKYHYIAEKAGVSQEKFNDALKDAGTKVTEFQRDGESAKEAFKALGISQDFAKKHMQTSSETMDVLLQKFAEFPDGMQKATIAQEIFGDEGANVIRVANLGADAMARYGEEAIKGNIAVSEAFAQKSKSYLEAEHRLDQLRSGWAAAVIEESNFLEMGTNMYTIIGDAVVEWTGDVQSGTDTFVDGLQTISNATNAVFPTVIEIGGMVGGAFVSIGGAVWGVGETIVDLVGKLIGFDEQSNSNITTLGHFSGLAMGASMAVENFATLIEFSSKGFETFGIAIQTYAISRLDYLQSAFYSTMASGSDLLAFFDDDFESDAQAYRQKAVKYDNAMVQALATGNGRLASIAKEREDLLKKVHSSDMIQAKMEETAYEVSVKQREGFAKNSENLAKKLEDDFAKSGKESLKRLEATMKALEKGKNKSVSLSKSTLAHQKGLESNARAYEKEQKEEIRLQKELNDEMARMQDEQDRAYMDYLRITGKKEKLFDLETEKILERFKNLGYSEEQLEEIEDARWENWAESGMDAIETVEEKSNEFTDGLYASLGSVFDVLLDGGDVFEALEGELDKMNKSNSSATSDNIMTGISNGSFDGIFTDSNGEMTTGGYQAMATAGHLFAQSAFGDSENVQRGEQFGQAAGTAIGSIWGPAGAIVGGMIGEIAGGAIGSLLGGEHSTRYDVNEDGTITEVDHKSGGLFSHSSNSDVGDATARLKTIEYSLEHYLEIFDVFDKDLALSVGTHKRVIDEYNTMFFNSLAGVSDEYLNQEYVSRNSFNKYWRDSISDEEWDKIEAGNEIKKAWERYADAKDEEVNKVLAEVFGNLEQTENAIFEFVNRDDVDAIYRDRIAKGEQYERELEALYANGQDVTLENYREIRDGITDPDILNGYIALEQQLLSNAQVADEYADVLEDARQKEKEAIEAIADAIRQTIESLQSSQSKYSAPVVYTESRVMNDITHFDSIGSDVVAGEIDSWYSQQLALIKQNSTYQITIDNSHNKALNEQIELTNTLHDKIANAQDQATKTMFDSAIQQDDALARYALTSGIQTGDWDKVSASFSAIVSDAGSNSFSKEDEMMKIAFANQEIQAVDAPVKRDLLDVSVRTETHTRDTTALETELNQKAFDMYQELIDGNELLINVPASMDTLNVTMIDENQATRDMLNQNFAISNKIMDVATLKNNTQDNELENIKKELVELKKVFKENADQSKQIAELTAQIAMNNSELVQNDNVRLKIERSQ